MRNFHKVMMAASVEGSDIAMVTGNDTAKVIQFNPKGLVSESWLDSLAKPKTDHEKVEFDSQFALLAAREFDTAYGKSRDVLDAAEEARDRLSTIPLSIARHCQGMFSATEKGKEARLKKYAAMCQIAGEELAKRHNVVRGADSYSGMMQKFPEGRYWVRLSSEARQALKWDIDLKKKIAGTEDLLYTNTRQVATTSASFKQKDAQAKTQHKARAEEGTGSATGQTLGEGKASAQTLKLNDAVPETVKAGLIKLNNAVMGLQFEKAAVAAKRTDSNVQLATRALAIFTALVAQIAANKVSSVDLGIIAADIVNLIQHGTLPKDVSEAEAEQIAEEVEGTELPDAEATASAEQPETDEGTEATPEAVNQ